MLSSQIRRHAQRGRNECQSSALKPNSAASAEITLIKCFQDIRRRAQRAANGNANQVLPYTRSVLCEVGLAPSHVRWASLHPAQSLRPLCEAGLAPSRSHKAGLAPSRASGAFVHPGKVLSFAPSCARWASLRPRERAQRKEESEGERQGEHEEREGERERERQRETYNGREREATL